MYRVKRLIKNLICAALYYSGLLFLYERLFLRDTISILTYHRIVDADDPHRRYSVAGICLELATFQKQMRYLQKHHTIVPLGSLLCPELITRAKRPVVITFDDGWRDNFDILADFFNQNKIPVTIFIAPEPIDSRTPFWETTLLASMNEIETPRQDQDLHDLVEQYKELCWQKRRQWIAQLQSILQSPQPPDLLLSWQEIKDASRSPYIDFQCHSHTHRLMHKLSDEEIEEEIALSTATIKEQLDKKSIAFAYPNGNWSRAAIRLLKKYGYQLAVTTRQGYHRLGDNLFTIRRIDIHDGSCQGWRGTFSRAIFAFRLTGMRKGKK